MSIKKVLQIILHLLGFPLLIAFVILNALHIIRSGNSYGIMVFVGIIITVLMAVVYYAVFFTMAKRKKKSIYKQTMVCMIVSVLCLGGFWALIDVALPDFLSDATSGTIFYEDLADDYNTRADVNKGLLDEYIMRNYANGNLDNEVPRSTYLKEGVRNEDVTTLLNSHFQSIDKDGYVTFVGPWLDLANGNRLTIPVLVHLVINEREVQGIPYLLVDENGVMQDDPVCWSILDMLGEPMAFDLGPKGMNVIPSNISGFIGFAEEPVNDILESVTAAIEDENVVGSPIYIILDGTELALVPSNESRGVLDYMSMGWLDSNGLLFAITSLFSVRKLFLIFAGIMAISTYTIGILREEEEKDKEAKKAIQES